MYRFNVILKIDSSLEHCGVDCCGGILELFVNMSPIVRAYCIVKSCDRLRTIVNDMTVW